MDSEGYRKTAPNVFNWDTVQLALKAAEEGVYCWEIDKKVVHYTDRCLTMMGLHHHEVAPNIFTNPEQTIHPEDLSFFRHELQRYLNGHTHLPMRIEIRLLSQTSRAWRWIRVNGLADRDEHHKPTRLVGVWVDISRRKTADQRAQEERDLFRTLIEHIPDNIYFKNRESRFVMANSATARKLGVSTPSDLIGMKDEHFFGKEMSDISRREELEIMETGRPFSSRIHHEVWKDKDESWSQITKFPWYDRDGHLKGIVGISSDVTKLVQAEQKAQMAADILDRRNQALEKEVDLAREIQLSLLPYSIPSRAWQTPDTPPRLRSANFHHIFAPSEGVAGDCFEVFSVGDTGVGAMICDVMGHGIRAALIASMLRGLMEQLSGLGSDPAQFLASLNRQLTRILVRANVTMFASAMYAYMDLSTGTLTLSSAGHPAPILLSPDGKASMPSLPRSMALGLLETTLYHNTELHLESGSKLMLYTDGLTEAANKEGDELGAGRVMAELEQVDPKNIKTMILGALKCAGHFTGCSQLSDDICLLGMEYRDDPIPEETPAEA